MLARAAAEANIPMLLSGGSLIKMEDVKAAGSTAWFQAYLPGDDEVILACMERVFPRLVRLRVAATLAGAAMVAGITLYANVQDALRYWG